MRSVIVVLFINYGKIQEACGGKPNKKPNVLFIVIDDLRPELGCYGSPVLTPNIDQLASQSIKFTNAHAQQTVCNPSRSSFLTSRRPDTTRVFDNSGYWRNIGGNFTTLPQYFKQNGYFTASIGKIFHHTATPNKTDDYPHSWSIPPYHPPTQQYKRAKVCLAPDGTKHEYLLCPVDPSQQPGGSLPDIQTADYTVSMMHNISSRRQHRSSEANKHLPREPFFLGVGFHKPHIPYKFPKEFLTLYPLKDVSIAPNPNLPSSLPEVAFEPYTSLREREDIAALNLSFPYGPVPLHYHKLIRQHYYAATSYVDFQVGKVLQSLEDNGFADNTIIVLVGDHGWQLGEHSEFAKFSNYATATRVPLMVYIPSSFSQDQQWNIDGLKHFRGRKFGFQNVFTKWADKTSHGHSSTVGGLVSDVLVELVDLFPTLTDLAGLHSVKGCPLDSHDVQLCTEGFSQVPLMKSLTDGSKINWKNCTFSQYPRPSDVPQQNTDTPKTKDIKIMGYAIRTVKFRYTEWIGFSPSTFKGNWSDVHARELYDHQMDAYEDFNVVEQPQYRQVVDELSKALRGGWKRCLPS